MEQAPDSPRIPSQNANLRSPKLIERLREAIRSRHYSRRTEKTYWYWIRWFVRRHGLCHSPETGGPEVSAFLSHPATEQDVAAATQNQGL